MLEEIRDIPKFARACLSSNRNIHLPVNVPYLGMGSSLYAAIAMKNMGLPVQPEAASDYASYLAKELLPEAVLISQSGYSSETLWNTGNFRSYMAIVNDPNSPLAIADNCSRVIELRAGEERGSATRTYINTLITLCLGLGKDPSAAVNSLDDAMDSYEDWGRVTAQEIATNIQSDPERGLVVLGNGPDYATARQVALILSETIHRPVLPMTVAQFDHGPKEASGRSITLFINSDGPERNRTYQLMQLMSSAGAICYQWKENTVPWELNPISSCVPFFFLAVFLSRELGITNTFKLGGKITQVESQ